MSLEISATLVCYSMEIIICIEISEASYYTLVISEKKIDLGNFSTHSLLHRPTRHHFGSGNL